MSAEEIAMKLWTELHRQYHDGSGMTAYVETWHDEVRANPRDVCIDGHLDLVAMVEFVLKEGGR